MPTKTFFNLEESKKEQIIKAAIHEFSRVPFDDTSITNIIEEARIPRGSFYQYFNDKADLYEYIMRDISIKKRKSTYKILSDNNGDLFKTAEQIFIKEYELLKDKTYHNMLLNFFSHSKVSMQENINKKRLFEDIHKDNNSLVQSINKELYTIQDDETLIILFHMLMGAMRYVLIRQSDKEQSCDEALKSYKKLINIMKYGVVKNEFI